MRVYFAYNKYVCFTFGHLHDGIQMLVYGFIICMGICMKYMVYIGA